MLKLSIAALSFGALVLGNAALAGDDYERPITDTLTYNECSACHMAFPAGFLPARSWSAIMHNLENHFGEDASLDETDRQAIEDYLAANAADSGNRSSKFLRSLNGTTPLRITDLRWWQNEHDGEVSQRAWKQAGSKSNCSACHRGAERGYFDDD